MIDEGCGDAFVGAVFSSLAKAATVVGEVSRATELRPAGGIERSGDRNLLRFTGKPDQCRVHVHDMPDNLVFATLVSGPDPHVTGTSLGGRIVQLYEEGHLARKSPPPPVTVSNEQPGWLWVGRGLLAASFLLTTTGVVVSNRYPSSEWGDWSWRAGLVGMGTCLVLTFVID